MVWEKAKPPPDSHSVIEMGLLCTLPLKILLLQSYSNEEEEENTLVQGHRFQTSKDLSHRFGHFLPGTSPHKRGVHDDQ